MQTRLDGLGRIPALVVVMGILMRYLTSTISTMNSPRAESKIAATEINQRKLYLLKLCLHTAVNVILPLPSAPAPSTSPLLLQQGGNPYEQIFQITCEDIAGLLAFDLLEAVFLSPHKNVDGDDSIGDIFPCLLTSSWMNAAIKLPKEIHRQEKLDNKDLANRYRRLFHSLVLRLARLAHHRTVDFPVKVLHQVSIMNFPLLEPVTERDLTPKVSDILDSTELNESLKIRPHAIVEVTCRHLEG